jgi:hypothetical protein
MRNAVVSELQAHLYGAGCLKVRIQNFSLDTMGLWHYSTKYTDA